MLIFVALLVGSIGIQFSVDRVVGSDGFFHIRQAAHPFGGMPWLPHSIFADGWVDHQLLFHVLLAPFAALPGTLGAKAGAALFAAVAIEALRRFLRSLDVPYPTLFALLPLAISWRFLLRMEMPRTQSLSLALLIAGTWAILHGRHKMAFAVAWAYAWTYQVALLLLPVALLHAVVRRAYGEHAWRGPAAVLAGLVAGFTIHPHSPGTWSFLYQHVVQKVINRGSLPVGGEWTEGGIMTLITQEPGGLLVLILALVLAARNRPGPESVFLVALAAAATVGAAVSIKFLEYSVPLSAVALAAGVRDMARSGALSQRTVRPLCAAVAAGLLLSASLFHNAVLATEPPPDRLAPALHALDAHAAPGDLVYHFSWSDFPELVFHGPEYRYIAGLDPHFLALHDADLWDLYAKLERGWGTNPSKPIHARFSAKWVVLVLPHDGAEALLSGDPGLRVLHRDPSAIVYAVSP